MSRSLLALSPDQLTAFDLDAFIAHAGVPVASVQKTSIRASMGKPVEQNEGHFPRLSWAKTLGFLGSRQRTG